MNTFKFVMGTLSLALIFVFSPFVLPGHGKMLAWTVLLCIVSRSNLIYHNANLEVQSIFALFLSILYGPWVAVFAAIFSTWPANWLSKKIGLYNPILVLMDTGHMIFIALLSSFLTTENFLIPALIIFGIAEVYREGVRFLTYHEHPIKYTIMGSFFMIMLYFVLTKYPQVFLKWLA